MTRPEGFPRDEFERQLVEMKGTLTDAKNFFKSDKDMDTVIGDTITNVEFILKRSQEYSSEQKARLNERLRHKQQQ